MPADGGDAREQHGKITKSYRQILAASVTLPRAAAGLAEHMIDRHAWKKESLDAFCASLVVQVFVGLATLAEEKNYGLGNVKKLIRTLVQAGVAVREGGGEGEHDTADTYFVHHWFEAEVRRINESRRQRYERDLAEFRGRKGIRPDTLRRATRVSTCIGQGYQSGAARVSNPIPESSSPTLESTADGERWRSLELGDSENSDRSRQAIRPRGGGPIAARQDGGASRPTRIELARDDVKAFFAFRARRGLENAAPEHALAEYVSDCARRRCRKEAIKATIVRIAKHFASQGAGIDTLDDRIIEAFACFGEITGAELVRVAQEGKRRLDSAGPGHQRVRALRNFLLLLLRIFHPHIGTLRLISAPRVAAFEWGENIVLELGQGEGPAFLRVMPAHLVDYCPTALTRRWLGVLDAGGGADGPLFPGHRGMALNIQSHRVALAPILAAVFGEEARVTPDRLRGEDNYQRFVDGWPAACNQHSMRRSAVAVDIQ